jgi:hypothetical protein
LAGVGFTRAVGRVATPSVRLVWTRVARSTVFPLDSVSLSTGEKGEAVLGGSGQTAALGWSGVVESRGRAARGRAPRRGCRPTATSLPAVAPTTLPWTSRPSWTVISTWPALAAGRAGRGGASTRRVPDNVHDAGHHALGVVREGRGRAGPGSPAERRCRGERLSDDDPGDDACQQRWR